MDDVNINSAVTTSIDSFAALVRNSINGCYLFSAEETADLSNPFQFRLLETNHAGARLVHSTIESIVGLELADIMIADRATIYQARFNQVMDTQQPLEIEEFAIVYNTPTRLRQHIIPLPNGLFVQAQDVTAAYTAETRLRDSEQYLSSVVNNVPIILYELDREGIFKLSTGRSLENIGLDINEAVGQSIYDFYPPSSPEIAAFHSALKGETVSTDSTLGEGHFTSRYAPSYDGEGKIIGVLGVSYDITARYNAEIQLQRAQRMEAVGQLTGGIAHDFNNLLAVILGNLDLLSGQEDLKPSSQEFVEQALAAAHRGANLTKRLLAFSRQQLLDPHPTDANQLIELTLRLLGRTLPENIEIAFQPLADLWLVQVDSAQLENAILNLCVNARDAMPQGGKLTLSTKNITVDADAAEQLQLVAGDYVTVAVKDTGKGIDEAMQSMVFEPFFTTKESGKGSGLGLSMVYGFVEQSQGGIDLESSPGLGSQFTLYFPKAEVALQPAELPEVRASLDTSGNGETILVVEDDWDVRQFVKKALLNFNYQVLEARNAVEGLELLDRGENITLLLSDVVLPGGLSGLGLAKQAQASHPNLKILLTTGYIGDAGGTDISALAQFDILPKPYRLDDLAKKVQQALSQP